MQAMESKPLKALLCQTKPKLMDISYNLERVDVSLQMYSDKDAIDIIIFPEMAFTGYNFPSAPEALPYAEAQQTGLSFQFMRNIAIRLNSYVIYGYIEREGEEGEIVLYNSAILIDRKGAFVCNYRKTNLYYNDILWAQEGNGFITVNILNSLGQSIKCAIAICMDINPKHFTSGQYEVAEHILKEKPEVLLFLANWVSSALEVVRKEDVMAAYNYWLHRLSPVMRSKEKLLFLVADRVGEEYDVYAEKVGMFFGSSCAMRLNPPKIIKNLDEKSQGYLMIETNVP